MKKHYPKRLVFVAVVRPRARKVHLGDIHLSSKQLEQLERIKAGIDASFAASALRGLAGAMRPLAEVMGPIDRITFKCRLAAALFPYPTQAIITAS